MFVHPLFYPPLRKLNSCDCEVIGYDLGNLSLSYFMFGTILYFEDCSHHQTGLDYVFDLLHTSSRKAVLKF